MERKRLFNTRIDENVIITMLAVSIMSFIILAFKVKNSDPPVSFDIRPSKVQAYTGDLIRFETNAHNFKSLQWDFGDSTKGESGKTSTEHFYELEGEYTVSLLVNDRSMEPVVITISPRPIIIDPLLAPIFSCPKTIEVGKLFVFRDSTKGLVSQRKWRFSESGDTDDTLQVASHTYKTLGSYDVSLMINGDKNRITTHSIIVIPAPQKTLVNNKSHSSDHIPDGPGHGSIKQQTDTATAEPPPAQIPGIEISAEDLTKELRGVADNDPKYTIEYFSRYTCNDLNIQVTLNYKPTDFEHFYNKLHELGSADKIRKNQFFVQINRNRETNCIRMLNVICKKKSGPVNIGNSDL